MLNSIRSLRWITLYAVLLGTRVAAGQDWPQYRGPNRDGKTTGFKAPAAWPTSLTKKWEVVVGSGVANPSLAGDRLYVITREGENEVIRCLNATTGAEIWKDSYPSEPATSWGAGNGLFVGARATPTVADGRVFTLGVNGMFTCYDGASGAIQWRKNEFVGQVPGFYASSSPIVVDGMCIAQLGAGMGEGARPGDVLGALFAYDVATGEKKWSTEEGSPAYASPMLMTVDGMKVVIAISETNLVAVNVSNGKVAWKIPHRQKRYNTVTPIVDGQTLIFAGPQTAAGMTAVKLSKQGDELKEEEAWAYKGNSLMFNTPVFRNGALFGISDRDLLFAVNTEHAIGWSQPIVPPPAAVGQVLPNPGQAVFGLAQQEEARGQGEGRGRRQGDRRGGQQRGRGRDRPGGGGQQPGYGTVVDAGSVLVALCPGADLVFFKPDAGTYTELARYKVSEKGEAYSHPILSGNRIYIKDKDSVSLWTTD
jgi:outer membrane protein assembly factor BamB